MKEMMMRVKGIRIIINTPGRGSSEINVPSNSYIEIRPVHDYGDEITVEEQVEINERLAEQDEAGLQSENPESWSSPIIPSTDTWLNKVCGNDQDYGKDGIFRNRLGNDVDTDPVLDTMFIDRSRR